MLRAKQVDGMIIFPTGGNVDLYEKMLKEHYPIVFVDRSVPDLPISSVMLNNMKVSELGVQHFIDRGYQNIGIMTTSINRNIASRIERIEGYKQALTENGMPVRNDYMKSLELNHIQDGLKEMLALDQPPDAVLAGNDLTLIEILKYVKRHPVNIPSDLAVIGIDEVSFASFYTPAITTVAQPTFNMGKKAADLLLDKIQNKRTEDRHSNYRFEPELMIRDSV
ncbi:HTH-type transcriptional repressor CytR [wastewater metagenome]|uniref:HTH-type transcriptional repressor CytR n=2 Tax=unclassified sequences TaxID=12908 RepID=A0A5B8RK67_9ZZZZ|nr:HTH-type transcriptional repressor CytR [uncultured organism]